jgi:hypothetical protein
MKTMREIRFVTTNYYNLQGLRLIPLGLLVLYTGYWANKAHYPLTDEDFIFLIGAMIVSILASLLIDLYYKRFFGVVRQTPESRKLESTLWTVGGVLAIAAFWLDVSYSLPLSLVGLVAGLALLADYLRMTRLVKGRYLIYYPIGAAVLMAVSLLPLFGMPGWWRELGLRAQMFGIVLVLGVFTVCAGIWSHIFLSRTLHAGQAAQ